MQTASRRSRAMLLLVAVCLTGVLATAGVSVDDVPGVSRCRDGRYRVGLNLFFTLDLFRYDIYSKPSFFQDTVQRLAEAKKRELAGMNLVLKSEELFRERLPGDLAGKGFLLRCESKGQPSWISGQLWLAPGQKAAKVTVSGDPATWEANLDTVLRFLRAIRVE